MAEIVKKYEGMSARQTVLDSYKELNKNTGSTWRLLYDNFDDPNWKKGDPIIGSLTFTDVILPSLPVIKPRDLEAEIVKLEARVAKLEGVSSGII